MSSLQPAAVDAPNVLLDCEGLVKWFDPRKGFGFVVGPQGQDIFIHFSVIQQSDGFRTLKDGEKIVYSAQNGAKGWSATAVRATTPKPAPEIGAQSTGPIGRPAPDRSAGQ